MSHKTLTCFRFVKTNNTLFAEWWNDVLIVLTISVWHCLRILENHRGYSHTMSLFDFNEKHSKNEWGVDISVLFFSYSSSSLLSSAFHGSQFCSILSACSRSVNACLAADFCLSIHAFTVNKNKFNGEETHQQLTLHNGMEWLSHCS